MPGKTPAFIEFVRVVAKRFREDRCMQIASSLTFTTLLAIVPLITVALTVISAFPVFRKLSGQLHEFLVENLLPESAHLIARYGEQFTANAAQLTAVGIAFLAVTAIMLLVTIEHAFNQIWRVRRPRSTMSRMFIYWALLTIGPVLLGASLSLTSWFVSVSLGLVKQIPGAGVALLNTVPFVLIWIALTILYATMPNRRVSIKDAAVGALLAAFAFEAMKRGFALYITQFPTYKLVYGAFASAPIFLLWIYLSWLVVLFGALVVAVLPEWRERTWQIEPAPGTLFFDALHVLRMLWHAHRDGEVVTLRKLHAAVRLRTDQIEGLLDEMSAARWVGRVGPGWTLIKDPGAIRVVEVYQLFVFRGAPPSAAGVEVEALARTLAEKMDQHMQVTLDELFSGREVAAVEAAR